MCSFQIIGTIDQFDLAKSINEGLNRNENHFIFFSADLNKHPDFSMEAWNGTFEAEVDRCYFGELIRAFSKSIHGK